MANDFLKKIIKRSVQKAKHLPDGSFERDCISEGIRLLNEAHEKLKNTDNYNNEIDHLISQGLILVYYERKRKYNQI